MCDVRRVLPVLAISVALLAPAGVRAQTRAEVERALVERIQELTPLHAAADAAADLADARARDEARNATAFVQDTVAVGPLRVITTRDQLTEARLLFGAEWAAFEPLLGRSSSVLEGVAILYHRRSTPYPYIINTGTARYVEFRTPVSDERVRAAIRGAIGAAAIRVLPSELFRWSGQLPLGSAVPPEQLYRLFVASRTELTQACATGSIPSCWSAFGEMDGMDDPIATWYTPAEQRAIAATVRWFDRAHLWQTCWAGTDDACHELLITSFSDARMLPYPALLRADLLAFALARGGAGSLDRLVESASAARQVPDAELDPLRAGALLGPVADIATHLGRAARMEPYALMAAWREHVLAGRPESPDPGRRGRTATLFWIFTFAALAARSTRWRFG